jgi:tetratricopeptide (TPR) repeat protein
VAIGGCARTGGQEPPGVGAENQPIQEKTIAGPFGEQIAEPPKTSPFAQPLEQQASPDPLAAESSGALKPPALDGIKARIDAYGRKFVRWNALNTADSQLSEEQKALMGACYQQMQRILADYNTLRTAVEGSDPGDIAANSVYNAKMQAVQQADIELVEGECGALVEPEPATAVQAGQQGPGRATIDKEIETMSAARDYKGIEQAWQQMTPDQQEQVGSAALMLYANALVYLQKEEQAAELYRRIIEKKEASGTPSAELMLLRKNLADLAIATGRYQDAQGQYIQISKDYLALGGVDTWAKQHLAILSGDQMSSAELADYSGLVRNYLGYIPSQDGYRFVWEAEKFLSSHPNSTVASNVETMRKEMAGAAEAWFNGILAEVDRLAKEKKYQEATALIKAQRPDMINDQQLDLLNARNDELVLAEAVEQETAKMAKQQELDQTWNSGLQLVNAGRYDEAIKIFDGMMETEYGAKADAKIVEISSMAAKEDRRKAADLFIRFTKTEDLEIRKRLLIESRSLLKGILAKYPRADITDKVLGNIQRVEQEMNAIDPNLIIQADSQATIEQPQESTPVQPATEPEDPFAPQPPIVEVPASQ